MASKTKFVCSSCGYESGKWLGKCPDCGAWNTFAEITVLKETKNASHAILDVATSVEPQIISKIKSSALTRIPTGFAELDRVLGGGIVPGSAVLLSGDPGIGKSTLLLELARNIAQGDDASGFSHVASDVQFGQIKKQAKSLSSLSDRKHIKTKSISEDNSKLAVSSLASEKTFRFKKVLYVSGEESEGQIKIRAERIGVRDTDNLYIFSNGDIDQVLAASEKVKPDLLIIDSIQTMNSAEFPGFAGSLPQLRHATSRIVSFAKKNNIPVFIIGHVTKEGEVAGPMLLSHMVDTVLYLEGESLTGTKILRSFKNRFGDTTEVGIFTMEEAGLIEISNTANFFLENKKKSVAGSCLTIVMEGSRPIIVEIQALTIQSNLSFPRRVSNGISEKRVELLLAVMQKHLKLPFDRTDIFVNVVGGLKITETASDLAVCLAVLSSFKNKALGSAVAIAEVGILGELKSVINEKTRIKEAKKLGFTNIKSSANFSYLSDIMRNL